MADNEKDGGIPDSFLPEGATVKATIEVGTKVSVAAEKLKPYLDHHKLTTEKTPLIVQVKAMGFGTTDLDETRMGIVFEVEFVDNDDAGIDGKVICVGFGDLATIG